MDVLDMLIKIATGADALATKRSNRELGLVCIPMAVETYGAWGHEVFRQLATRHAYPLS